ncbi:hypothetical protein [Nocardia asiatica]|uniref:hypothetical protein n=1 Tax=Nocardia asiatica TaxID=209252 RepID=UPI0002FAD1F4|nr:hypothetical protein [Nocardia asiatica]
MAVHTSEDHIDDVDRYAFDFGVCSPANGFAQIDTSQDASYFGTWANPTSRVIVSFAEGDLYITRCDTDAEFVDEMRALQQSNDKHGWGPARIDTMLNTAIAQKFADLGLGDMLHPDQLDPANTSTASNALAAAALATPAAATDSALPANDPFEPTIPHSPDLAEDGGLEIAPT